MEELKKLTRSQARIDTLEAMGLHSLEDVLMHLPYRYDEISEIFPPDDQGKICVEARVMGTPALFFKGRFSRLSIKAQIKNDEYTITIFNRHFLKPQLTSGKIITVIGKCEGRRITASQIMLKPLQENAGLHPVYSLKEGITAKAFSNYVKKAMDLKGDELYDGIPYEYRQKYDFLDKREALKQVHFPQNKAQAMAGMRTLKYEEFLDFSLTMQFLKTQRENTIGIGKVFDRRDVAKMMASLPFELTDDQKQAVEEILHDLETPSMMYRFLQGDVGSGKTVVVAIGLYANYLAHYQGALMAPTEVLARQHYQTLSQLFKDTDVKMALLTGSLSPKEKEALYEKIENGEVDLIIGTHALFQKKVIYHNLGFVITDEQHRFGVKQRQAFKNKGQDVDFLIMSATPIPRTLALSFYGDMDVSTIHTMPAGRKGVITRYFKGRSMKPFLQPLKDYLKTGGQVYVICAMIQDHDDMELKSATQVAEAMARYFKDQYRVGLLHGGLSEDEKEAIMDDFFKQKIAILVSTTVIEVGIDVKNANMMVIYDADRFGMSQIHQLRGRVGRGDQQGYCFLLSASVHESAIKRLEFMETHQDGFEISAYDLKVRGPGEVLGQAQSGLPNFLVGDIFLDYDILEMTRDDAQTIIADYYKYNEYSEMIERIKAKMQQGETYID